MMEMKQSWNQTANLLIMTARIFTNDLDSTLVLQNSEILGGKKWIWNCVKFHFFFTLMF